MLKFFFIFLTAAMATPPAYAWITLNSDKMMAWFSSGGAGQGPQGTYAIEDDSANYWAEDGASPYITEHGP